MINQLSKKEYFSRHHLRYFFNFVAVCVILIPSASFSTTYYVSSSEGKDSNGGTTSSTPWKSLEKIGSKSFLPGDRIALKRGDVWRESFSFSSSGSNKDKIIISSYGEGKNPTINGSTVVSDWATFRPGVYAIKYNGICHGILEDLKPLMRASSQVLSDGQWFFDGSTIYYRPTSGPPSSRLVERCARGSLLQMKEQHHVIIENITFYGANSYGIRIIDSSDIEIRNCRIENNGQDGISLQRLRPELECGRIRIIGNALEWNANGIYIIGKEDGFKSDGYKHCEINDNTIIYTNYQNFWGHNTKDGHAIGMQNSSFCRIEGNTITDNYTGIALWTSEKFLSQGNVVTRNFVVNNHQYGIVHGANGRDNSYDNIWSYNIIAYNGKWPGKWGGLRINRIQTRGNRYVNNTLVGNDINIYLYSFPDSHVLEHNLSINPVNYHVWLDESSGRNNVLNNNCYFSKGENLFLARSFKRLSFSGWKERTGQDKSSFLVDPLMKSSEPKIGADFCLKTGSLCVGIGACENANGEVK
jgi:parallel beta-helix repeat protein